MTLEKLNNDFNLNITENQIDNLATDICCEYYDTFGVENLDFQKIKNLIMNNLIKGQLLLDLINDSEFATAEEIMQDQYKKMLIAKSITQLVIWKLIPSKGIKIGD